MKHTEIQKLQHKIRQQTVQTHTKQRTLHGPLNISLISTNSISTAESNMFIYIKLLKIHPHGRIAQQFQPFHPK